MTLALTSSGRLRSPPVCPTLNTRSGRARPIMARPHRQRALRRWPNPLRKARCTNIQTMNPGKPLRRTRPTLTIALKRPMAAALPRSRYLKGTLSSPFSRRLIVLAACRPPCIATSHTPGRLLIDAMSPTAKTSGCPGRVRSGSTAIRPGAVGLGPGGLGQHAGQWRGLDAGGPDHGAAVEAPLVALGALGVDPERIDADDAQAHANLDAHLLELGRGPPGELAAEVGQRLLAAVDQDDPDRRGIDVPEVLGETAVGELADLPGQLDAGRPGTDDGEGHPETLERRVRRRLGELQGAVDAAPELHGVVDRLHAGSDHGELVVAEVRLPGAGRHDQAVVGVVG